MSAPVLFVVLNFANTTLYIFGGVGSITPAGPAYSALSDFPYGETFVGLGWLAKLSTIPQTTKVQAQNVTLSLSGIPAELVSEAIKQVRITGTAQVYLGFFNSSGTVIPDPVQLFSGALDVPTLQDSGETCTISITAENPLISLNLAPNRLFCDADQQKSFPGDLGLSFVEALGNQNLFWPSPAPNSSTYPNFLQIISASPDVAVGGTMQITVKMTYSDGSTYSYPGGGSGSTFTHTLATTNPKVATIDPSTGILTGVSPGECSVMCRVTFYVNPTVPSVMYRAANGIIVHS
jgi:hypothetical protein